MAPSAQPMPRAGRLGVERLTLVEAAQSLRQGELTSEDYTTALLLACQQHVALNAFIALDADAVMADARHADLARAAGAAPGPLHGVPLAIKDNVNTCRLPTSGGTAALRENRPQRDAVVVERLRQAGAIVLGKTNLHELAMGWTGNNPSFGRVVNPQAPGRIAGGSSGGSAAAVAAFMSPAAIGTDTNGSIRIPASFCGVAALRPSLGRYPMDGVMPLAPSLDTIGTMARSVADLALLDSVLRDARAPRAAERATGLRLGISPAFFLDGLDTDVAAIFEAVRRRLVDHGVEIVVADMPDLAAMLDGAARDLIRYEAARSLPRYLAEHAPGISMARLAAAAGSDLRLDDLRQQSSALSGNYDRALLQRDRVRSAYRTYFLQHRIGALMHPVVRMPAPLADARFVSPAPDVTINGSLASARDAFASNVTPASLAGSPVLALPAGLTPGGLPVGMAFEALHGEDEALLTLGAALERCLGVGPSPKRGAFDNGSVEFHNSHLCTKGVTECQPWTV